MKKSLLIITLCLSTILGFGQDTIRINSDFDLNQWAKDMEIWAENYAQNIEEWADELEKNIENQSIVVDIDLDELEKDMDNVIIINGNEVYNNYKHEKKKVITANYKVEKNALLTMVGKFGDIKISEWDKNEIDFRVEIKTKSNKESNAQEMLDAISIDISGTENSVSAQTILKKGSYKSCSYSIVYYVKVPYDVMMDLKNSYGDIEIGTVRNDIKVNVKYGDLQADSLLAKSNLDISYGDLDVQYANFIVIDMMYGDVKAKNVKELTGKLSYSDMSCTEADKIDLVLSYTDSKIDKVNNIIIDDHYSDISIYLLENEMIGTSKYGDIIVRNVGKKFNSIQVNANYSDVKIGLSDDHEFKYDLETTYGDITDRFIDLERNASQISDKGDKMKIIGKYGSNPSSNVILTGYNLDIIIGQ